MSVNKLSYPEIIAGGNTALRLNMQRGLSQSVRATTVVLSDDEISGGPVQRRVAAETVKKGALVLRPDEEYLVIESPKFKGFYYAVVERRGALVCSADDPKIAARCIELAQIAQGFSPQAACQVFRAYALVSAANALMPRQRWQVVVDLDGGQVSVAGRFADDLAARPRWNWSLAEMEPGDLIAGVKEILYSNEAYKPSDDGEQVALDARVAMAQANEGALDENSPAFVRQSLATMSSQDLVAAHATCRRYHPIEDCPWYIAGRVHMTEWICLVRAEMRLREML